MRTLIASALLLGIGLGAAHAGGTVAVSFIEPDKFTDAANTHAAISETTKVLEAHLIRLGQRYLADGQTLSIEVLDVDLAGEMRPSRRGAMELRIARGGADWPRMKLRYALEGGGQAPQRGEESIADMSYQSQIPQYAGSDSLRYEKHMLEAWFKSRFAPAQ